MRFLVAILLLLVALPAHAQGQGQGMSQAMVVGSCGGSTLTTGPVAQLTMDTTGRLCQSGIGSNVCSQATAYLARTTGGNEGGNAINITALICGLVTDGVITGTLTGTSGGCGKFDAFYLLAQQNQADAKLNICGTAYGLPAGGTFTAYQGLSAFPSPGLDTGFNAAIAPSPFFTQNHGGLSAWLYSAPAATVQMGTINTSSGSFLMAVNAGTWYCFINDGGGGTSVPSPGSTGLFYCDRTSSTGVNFYWNGVSKGSSAGTSLGPDSHDFFVGGMFVAGFNMSATLSEATVGADLGPTLELAFYNRLRTYLTAVGVP